MMTGGGTFQAPRTYATNFGPGSLAVADFDGDGRLDLAKVDNDGMSVLLGNGEGSFQSPQIVHLAPPRTGVV